LRKRQKRESGRDREEVGRRNETRLRGRKTLRRRKQNCEFKVSDHFWAPWVRDTDRVKERKTQRRRDRGEERRRGSGEESTESLESKVLEP
jgi:hypothetical protein